MSFLLAEDRLEDTAAWLRELVVEVVHRVDREIVLKYGDGTFVGALEPAPPLTMT